MSLNAPLLDSVLRKYISSETGSEDTLQSAALIVKAKNGNTLYSNAFGKLTFDADSPPFTADSVCWVASLTKLVTAVSAMQLVEQGKIGLEDDVGKVVPELSNKEILKGFDDDGKPILVPSTKPLTLRNLLTHSSGFCYDLFDPNILKWSASVGRTASANSMTVEGFTFPLLFEPGEGWMYGVGIDWAGRVVEVLSNSTLEEYMQRHIFKPLGMSSTTFYIDNHPDMASRRAAIGFRPSPQKPLAAGDTDPAPKNPAMASGGAGLYTTANDYAKFLGSLVSGDGKLLKPESFTELLKPRLDDPTHFQAFCDGPFHDVCAPEFPRALPVSYALGGAVNLEDSPGKRRKGSMMWSGVTTPRWWIDPETGIAATLMTQVQPMGDAVVSDLYDELEKAIYQALSE